jgi:hypothetical protein
MSLAPFARHAERLNAAVESHLANVEVAVGDGAAFGAVLGREASAPFGSESVDAAEITLGFLASRAPGLKPGDELLIDFVPHRVSGQVQPDETGWLTVSVYPVE